MEKTKNYTQLPSSELVDACMYIAMHTCRSLESTREMHRNVRVGQEMGKGERETTSLMVLARREHGQEVRLSGYCRFKTWLQLFKGWITLFTG